MNTSFSHLFKCATLSCTLVTTSTQAGEHTNQPITASPANNGNFCHWLENKPGTLYKNKKNPYIQQFSVFGRFHGQYVYVDGRGADGTSTRKFNYDTEEIRRFRLGLKIKFFNYFQFKSSADLENDLAPTGLENDHDIEYANIENATLSFNAHKAFSISTLDSLKFAFGKKSISNSAERSISSKYIKTVERSALTNYSTPKNSTGLYISASKASWDFDLAIISGDNEPEFSKFDGSNDYFYLLHAGYQIPNPSYADKSRIDLHLTINGDDERNSSSNPQSRGSFNQDWIASLSTQSNKGRFHLLTDIIYGKNGSNSTTRPQREGNFWGVIILPSYWIIEDRLEAVFRYQYARASEKEGFRIYSRYPRLAGQSLGFSGANDLSDGRGDSHHSAYLGMNYHLCGENAKLMTGIEYDNLDSGSQKVYEGLTAWAAFRIHF